jgi:hypothetical protein
MADKSSILRDTVVDLKKLKNEAVELAKQEVISQAKEKIEANAKRIFETMLFESEEGETSSEDAEDSLEIEIDLPSDDTSSEEDSTYVDQSDDFNFDENNNDENIETSTMENKEEVNMVDTPDMDDLIKEFLELAEEDGIEIEADVETEIEDSSDSFTPSEEEIELEGEPEIEAEIETTEEISEDEFDGAIDSGFTTDTGETEEDEMMELSEEEMEELEAQLQEELARLDEELAGFEDETEAEIEGLESGEEDAEVLPEGEECEEGEEPIEEASMSSDANLKHKNAKPTSREANARKVNMDEAREMYNKLSEEVTKILNENKTFKAQVQELKSVNESLSGKLKETTSKLYEAAVITAKTAYVNRLFLEHTTTQDQKKTIVNAFNKANNREEVKALYESYNTTLGSTVLNEGFETKISKVVTESTNKQSNIVHGVDVSKFKKLIEYKSK